MLKNKRGSTEILAFIMVLPFLLLPILNTVNMLTTLLKYDELRQTGRATIIKMEMDGGMHPNEALALKNELINKGFNDSLDIHYTPYPVEYGKEVNLLIRYMHPSVYYTIGLKGIERKLVTYELVYGPVSTISKKYFR